MTAASANDVRTTVLVHFSVSHYETIDRAVEAYQHLVRGLGVAPELKVVLDGDPTPAPTVAPPTVTPPAPIDGDGVPTFQDDVEGVMTHFDRGRPSGRVKRRRFLARLVTLGIKPRGHEAKPPKYVRLYVGDTRFNFGYLNTSTIAITGGLMTPTADRLIKEGKLQKDPLRHRALISITEESLIEQMVKEYIDMVTPSAA